MCADHGPVLGPVAVWGYYRFGRAAVDALAARAPARRGSRQARWASVAVGASHCGAGCTLGDIIAATGIFAFGLTLAGQTLWAEYLGSFVLAVALGLAFQYFAIKPMRDLGVGEGIAAAAKADILSLTAFEVGCSPGWR